MGLEKKLGRKGEVAFEESRQFTRGTLKYNESGKKFFVVIENQPAREVMKGAKIYLLQGQKTGRGVIQQFRPYVYSP